MLAIQYLEDRPDLAQMPVEDARALLRSAFEHLPLSIVILGWNVPDGLFQACAEETQRGGAKLYRWHPLLTGSAAFASRPEWQTVGLDGERVHGFRDLPEFTFLCPNCPPAAEAVLEHFRQAIQSKPYAGVFLDRIRFPSPAQAPERFLACFCDHCVRAAAGEGLDLPAIRRSILELLSSLQSGPAALRMLLSPWTAPENGSGLAALHAFLEFRARSITRFVNRAASIARAAGLDIGLDCFSPGLTGMVGQCLAELDSLCDWIKVMTYGHAFGPATLPYEFTHLAHWMVERFAMNDKAALQALSQASGLPLPASLADLMGQGISSHALAQEIHRGREMGVRHLLAGIELVEVPGVSRLTPPQIAYDLRAFNGAGADGFALSWDLSWMPLDRLDLVRSEWKKRG